MQLLWHNFGYILYVQIICPLDIYIHIYIYIIYIYIHTYIYIYIYVYIYIYKNNYNDVFSTNLVRKSARLQLRTRALTYKKVDDEKPLIQNLKFHVINRQLNKFTKYDVTV